jgi:hypothetical protein
MQQRPVCLQLARQLLRPGAGAGLTACSVAPADPFRCHSPSARTAATTRGARARGMWLAMMMGVFRHVNSAFSTRRLHDNSVEHQQLQVGAQECDPIQHNLDSAHVQGLSLRGMSRWVMLLSGCACDAGLVGCCVCLVWPSARTVASDTSVIRSATWHATCVG